MSIKTDTLVATPHNNMPIGELPFQGAIYAYDIETKQKVATQYRNCMLTRRNAEIYKLTLKDKSIIYCTFDHKILTHNRDYVFASELNTDDTVVTINNKKGSKVQSVEKLVERADVYDLEVPQYHNFILANGVVVHNCRYALEKYANRKGN